MNPQSLRRPILSRKCIPFPPLVDKYVLEGSRTPIFGSTIQGNNRYTTSTVGNEGVEPSQVFLLPDSKSGASQPVAPVTQK